MELSAVSIKYPPENLMQCKPLPPLTKERSTSSLFHHGRAQAAAVLLLCFAYRPRKADPCRPSKRALTAQQLPVSAVWVLVRCCNCSQSRTHSSLCCHGE